MTSYWNRTSASSKNLKSDHIPITVLFQVFTSKWHLENIPTLKSLVKMAADWNNRQSKCHICCLIAQMDKALLDGDWLVSDKSSIKVTVLNNHFTRDLVRLLGDCV